MAGFLNAAAAVAQILFTDTNSTAGALPMPEFFDGGRIADA